VKLKGFLMRQGAVTRTTRETNVFVELKIDGVGMSEISTGVGFFDHMLDQVAKHASLDLKVIVKGDLHIDDHHTVEDTGIGIGQALKAALGDLKGINRYASVYLPMDETLTRIALDLSGRPFLVFRSSFPVPKIGSFDTQLVQEFFQALSMNAGITLHVETLYGTNAHHIAESCFKGFARALRQAASVDELRADQIPSTKGTLSA
jgi:imidazoleglycerol-phosphate dehydratase